jgi:pyruvate formate lyase activating enzyme
MLRSSLRPGPAADTIITAMAGKALHFQTRPDGRVACTLCPNACIIAEGKHGICRVRFNRGGSLEIPFYGKISSISVDPIEKKPLYHFHPGAGILSIGFVGCSFHCKFCQNHRISQTTDVETRSISPQELVQIAKREGSFGIAYTYSEPLIHFEYIMDCSRLARESGIKNVLVSNGYLQEEPARELIPLIDAANIDLKANDPAFYTSEVGGELDEVKRFISQAAGRTWLEVTTLVIPTKNDDPAQIEEIARFLASLDKDIPLHLSCYYPTYKYTLPPTPPETVRALAEVARRHLSFVYIGNVGYEETNTSCPKCQSLLVRRRGYDVTIEGVSAGACSSCGEPVRIVGLA